MTKYRQLPLLFLFTPLTFATYSSNGCSIFCFGDADDGQFVARNYDWNSGEGLIVINKRSIAKQALSFDNPVKWKSKYGSISFCQYGREFPCDGMNEAGLMISVLWLAESHYPRRDKRPSISTLQWVQYQLDTAKSVAEIVASAKGLRIKPISKATLHYFVCDKTGDCATIEFLKGKMVVHRGEQLAHRCLTNNSYVKSAQSATRLKEFGGSHSPGQSGSSLDRYCRAAVAAKKENWPTQLDVKYGFRVLADLGRTDYTKWRIVYNLTEGVIHFRTFDFPQTKSIHLADFDLTTAAPVMVCNMNIKAKGELNNKFSAYSAEQNQRIFTSAMKTTGVLHGVSNHQQLIKQIAKYPETYGFPVALSPQ